MRGVTQLQETFGGGCGTSQEARDVRLSERIIVLLRKGPPFVRYLFEIKIRRPLINPVVFSIVSKRHRQFTFNGRNYRYFYHLYNETWRNERAVELPIIWEEVEKHDAERILEIGNVLSHHYPVRHTIIDKHEQGDGITNLDVIDFHTENRYDLIISISTMEHVGFNEDKSVGKETTRDHQDHQKPLRVIQHLKGLLTQEGKLVVTIPLGYNPKLDQLLREDSEGVFTGHAYLKRVSKSNKWVEIKEEEIQDARYGSPFSKANVLAIYTFDKTNV